MLYLNLVVLTYYYYHHNFPTVADKTQWGMLVTNVEQGKNNTFTFPIAFKNNLYFYWAFDYAGYFYNLIIKNKDINSCYIYGAYPNGTEQAGELAPTGVSGISVFIGS